MGSAHEARWAGISPAVSATVVTRIRYAVNRIDEDYFDGEDL